VAEVEAEQADGDEVEKGDQRLGEPEDEHAVNVLEAVLRPSLDHEAEKSWPVKFSAVTWAV